MPALLLILFALGPVFAQPVKTVVDYLRQMPAHVSGSLAAADPVRLYQGKWGPLSLNMQVNPDQNINYSFSEEHLHLDTREGITLSAGGVPVEIKSITYYESTGKFEVKTDTPMGMFEDSISEYIAEELDRLYRPKVLEAFGQLKKIREQQNLGDVKKVTDAVLEIFKSPGSAPLPDITGSMELVFTPDQSKTLQVDKMTANITARDRIAAGFEFKRKGTEMKVTGLHVASLQGIRIHGETNWPEVSSINIKSARLTEGGLITQYDIGGEEVVGGLVLVFKAIQAQATQTAAHDCVELPKFKAIRDQLDKNFQDEVSILVRRHEAELLKAGISEQLLAAFR